MSQPSRDTYEDQVYTIFISTEDQLRNQNAYAKYLEECSNGATPSEVFATKELKLGIGFHTQEKLVVDKDWTL